MASNRSKRGGFSLVELVIVVVIIGIIAAIAVPRISRGAKGATDSAVRGNMAGLRAAIDLYAAEHGGTYPGKNTNTGLAAGTELDFADQLTKFSDAAGKTGAYDAATGIVYGPYLRNGLPPLPVGANAGSTAVIFDILNSPPVVIEGGGEGWVYNPNTGEIKANTLATDEGGTNYSDY